MNLFSMALCLWSSFLALITWFVRGSILTCYGCPVMLSVALVNPLRFVLLISEYLSKGLNRIFHIIHFIHKAHRMYENRQSSKI